LLNAIEANPDDDHPLKGNVLPITLICYEEFAKETGATELRIYNPDPNILDLYGKYGFTYINKSVGQRAGDYMIRSVNRV
jgi:hypothetical protein